MLKYGKFPSLNETEKNRATTFRAFIFISAMGSLRGDLPGTSRRLSGVSLISVGEYYVLLSMSKEWPIDINPFFS